MPQLRQYPQVDSIEPTDAVWLDRLGVGTVWFEGLTASGGDTTDSAYVDNFGAVVDDPDTDSYPAFAFCLANFPYVRFQAGTYYLSQGITIPGGVTLQGDAFLPNLVDKQGSCLQFALNTPVCVQVGDGGNNLSAALLNTIVSRAAGSVPSGSIGVLVAEGYNPVVRGVGSVGHAICGKWLSSAPYGITSHVEHFYTAAATQYHMLVDSWPELFLSQCRLGCNGGIDVNCTAYMRVTGGGLGGSGPNGIFFNQVQMNQGVNAPTHGVEWVGLTHTDSNALEYKFAQCHIEAVSSAVFYATSAASINRLNMTDVTVNCPSAAMFSIAAATGLDDVSISGCELFVTDVTLAPTAQINSMSLVNNVCTGALSLTAAANSTVMLFGNTWGGATLLGAANYLFADRLTSGSVTHTGAGNFINLTPDATLNLGDLAQLLRLEIKTGGAVALDSTFYSQIQASNPVVAVDATDYYTYVRGSNEHQWYIGGNLALKATAAGIAVYKAGVQVAGITDLATFTGPVATLSTTVAALPSAVTSGAGARAYVTDANASTFASVVAAGGSNKVPVVSDGAVWRIG